MARGAIAKPERQVVLKLLLALVVELQVRMVREQHIDGAFVDGGLLDVTEVDIGEFHGRDPPLHEFRPIPICVGDRFGRGRAG